MLTEADRKEFASIVRGTFEAFGKEPTQNLLKVFWSALAQYDMQSIRSAFTSHIRTSKFSPSPSEIIEKIESANGCGQRPGPDEAWAMIPKDEETSSVITEEMLRAYAVAAPMIHEGEKIAARMAFKDAYTRICDESKARGIPVKWVVSRGWDKSQLGCVLDEAVRIGRISAADAAPYLAEIEFHSPLVAGLLEGTKGTHNEDKAKEFLAALKTALKPPEEKIDWDQVNAELDAMNIKDQAA